MNELDERARRVLDVARALHNPSAADAARVRAGFEARVLADPMLLEPRLPPALGATGIVGKLLLAFGVGGSAGFLAGFLVAQGLLPVAQSQPFVPAPSGDAAIDMPAKAAVAAASTGVKAPPDGVDTVAALPGTEGAEPPGAAAAPTTPRVEPKAAASAGVTSQLKAELEGLRRAQELLHKGDAAWALARLDELDRAKVSSVLLEERMATRAIAECMLGKDGPAQAQAFERQFPGSAQLGRVQASCAVVPQTGARPKNGSPTQTETRGSRHE